MKIKQKKQLNLPQLIEWLLESGKSECIVISNMNNIVRLEPYGAIRFSQEKFYPEEIFTVTTEQEITEDTPLDLVARFTDENGAYYTTPKRMSINTCLEAELDDVTCTHFYIENGDRELILIWRDGKLVE